MNKKVRLAGALGALTTASIAVTAFTLPQFNSLDSYLYRPTNWTEAFASKQAAIDYLNNSFENGLITELFKEEQIGTRTVNEYLVSASLDGIKNDYFSAFSLREELYGEDGELSAEDIYKNIKNDLMKEITSHLVAAITTKTDLEYIPSSEYLNNSVFSTTNSTSSITEYFRGLGDSTHTTLAQAFSSLLDQSQIAFEYNGVNYNTVDQVIAAWMTAEGFDLDSAFKEVIEHVRWEATGSYTDTTGRQHAFQTLDSNSSQTDKDTFIAYAEEQFYNQMKQFENIENIVKDESDWMITSDYENSRDAWISSNTSVVEPFINYELQTGTMGDAWGYSDYTLNDFNGKGSKYFPDNFHYGFTFWQGINDHGGSQSKYLPDISSKLDTNIELATYAFLAWHGLDFNGTANNEVGPFISQKTEEVCSGGTPNKASTAWIHWETFAEYMGFTKIEIPLEDRPTTTGNPDSKWWEPDCEGVYNDSNYGGNYDNITFFGDWFLPYFGYGLRSVGEIWVYNNWLFEGTSTVTPFLLSPTQFKFSSEHHGGALTGMTVLEAMLQGGGAPATENDYITDIRSTFVEDFRDWLNAQDVVYYWDKNYYSGRTEAEAMAKVNEAIRQNIEMAYASITTNQIVDISYDINDSHQAVLRALNSNFNMTGYDSIESARNAVLQLSNTEGADKIFNEIGIIKFMQDDFYPFDTTEEYLTIEEAMLDVNWNSVYASTFSSSGQTGSYESLVEYNTNRVQILKGFNGSIVDIVFTNSIEQFANQIANGYDFSSIDPSIDSIGANITAHDDDAPVKSTEYITYGTSLNVDAYNEDNIKWIESDEFIVGSEEQIEALEAARKELIQYWIDYIGA